MIKSMTAYGRGEDQERSGRYVVEIRSVNHRYRDVAVKLPMALQGLEDDLRSLIAKYVQRGRIEVVIQRESGAEESPHRLEVNVPVLKSYLNAFKQISDYSDLKQDVSLEYLAQMKDVLIPKPEETDLAEARSGCRKALSDALLALVEMRTREGEAIEADFRKRIDRIESYLGRVRDRRPDVVESYRDRLRKNIASLVDEQELDRDRLAQEVAYMAERSDITEEIVRAQSHLKQFKGYLCQGGAVGRRLDFLVQEIHREVNTMSAKASDADISGMVVEMKAELERLREQIQNVE